MSSPGKRGVPRRHFADALSLIYVMAQQHEVSVNAMITFPHALLYAELEHFLGTNFDNACRAKMLARDVGDDELRTLFPTISMFAQHPEYLEIVLPNGSSLRVKCTYKRIASMMQGEYDRYKGCFPDQYSSGPAEALPAASAVSLDRAEFGGCSGRSQRYRGLRRQRCGQCAAESMGRRGL